MVKNNKDALLFGAIVFLILAIGFFAYILSGIYLSGNAVKNDNVLRGVEKSSCNEISKWVLVGMPITADNGAIFNKVITHKDLRFLKDSKINFNNKIYNIREVLVSGQRYNNFSEEMFVTVENATTSHEDDYGNDTFLEANRDSLKYYYIFDDPISINSATLSNPLSIRFLGQTLKIIDASNDGTKLTAYIGKKIITIVDGDAYFDENIDDPNWVWNFGNLNVNKKTTIKTDSEFEGPYIGIENDFVYDDASDNPPGIRDCINFPKKYIRVCLKKVNAGMALVTIKNNC